MYFLFFVLALGCCVYSGRHFSTYSGFEKLFSPVNDDICFVKSSLNLRKNSKQAVIITHLECKQPFLFLLAPRRPTQWKYLPVEVYNVALRLPHNRLSSCQETPLKQFKAADLMRQPRLFNFFVLLHTHQKSYSSRISKHFNYMKITAIMKWNTALFFFFNLKLRNEICFLKFSLARSYCLFVCFVMSPGVINAPFFALCTHLAQVSLELATSWSSYQLCRLKTDSSRSTLK